MPDDSIKDWEPGDEKELNPSVINQIIFDILGGNPDPEQARRLLQYFVDVTENGIDKKIKDGGLLEFIRNAFIGYLAEPEEKNLERKLGLIRKRARPTDVNRQHQVAWTILEQRLLGKNQTSAVLVASKQYYKSTRVIEDYWRSHKETALRFAAYSRGKQSSDNKANWTEDEKNILKKIYVNNIIERANWTEDEKKMLEEIDRIRKELSD